MSDATALIAAIRAAPKDDAPRLIYADWLDENGRPGRAEFIRVQCALARKKSPSLRQRETELLAAHYATFAHPLVCPGLLVRFHRGFAVGFGHSGFFVRTRFEDGQPINDLLRFHPHRTVLGVSTYHSPASAAEWVGSATPFTTVGTYTPRPIRTSDENLVHLYVFRRERELCGRLDATNVDGFPPRKRIRQIADVVRSRPDPRLRYLQRNLIRCGVMSDAAALLAAIRTAPYDDAPRLIYADWLDENGQPERAEFIRIQCQLARVDDSALRRRETELLAAHHDAFASPLAAPHMRFRFRRGFIVAFGHTGVFASRLLRDGAAVFGDWLQFHPDGSVFKGSAAQPVTEHDFHRVAIGWLGQARSWAGSYRMTPFSRPARLHADFYLVAATRFRGEWDGSTMTFDIHGYGTEVRRYVHYHVPGFDSFPET